MKIVCIGGGPADLYFALLMKQRNPAHDITVVERNKPYDTFGWGVVFSDATMDNMRDWDKPTADEIQEAFNHWDDIELLFVETPRKLGPFGSGGCSENYQSGGHASVLNAIYNATGVRMYEIPARPEKIKAALEAKAAGKELKPEKYFLGSDLYDALDEIAENPVKPR